MKKWWKHFFKKSSVENTSKQPEPMKENPFIPRFREVLERVLALYSINYQEFCPLLIDTDTPQESMLLEDDVEMMLEQISGDLNFLRIATERPAYFSHYIERMYEENGLIVQLEDKTRFSVEGINVVLDMEEKGELHRECIQENIHYIPLYKKSWNHRENLDISIPIGYNTVIVKGI